MIVLVHGIRSDSENSLDSIKPFLIDDELLEFDYGFIGVLSARFGNRSRSIILKDTVERQNGDVTIVCHSNGGTIVADALDLGLNCKKVVMIHPALSVDWKVPDSFTGEVICFHSEKDKVGWLAWAQKVFSPLNIFFGKFGWGKAMMDGIKDEKVENINDGSTHSGGFESYETLQTYARKINA